MKPAAFEYHAPQSLPVLLELLARYQDDGKLIAGGQSLVPTMNFRLARPGHLVDVNGVAALDYLRSTPEALHIGALTRHAAFHRPVIEGPLGTLLTEVVGHIAHYPIRQRGTFAGSVAHADPASEWCLVAATLDATIIAQSQSGTRELSGSTFFQGIFSTQLRADEVLTEVRLSRLDATWRCGFYEYSRRAGDFALAMTVTALRVQDGTIREARVGIGGVADHPIRLPQVERALVGQAPSRKLFTDASALAAGAVDPMEDLHASAAYRRDLVRATTRRALEQACDLPAIPA
ncbi:MAG: xanthine dehydrogenase family protein subunit M [Burkholderiales bacterium]